ncbi:hypothetical protein L6452_12935 [Arctium lappa]|uniref:Uncharacterized protein n=1 Tax=Arctium lappa TaxID=4217 RepID=A0ACB9CGT0_ARCLA|nr:hypothetical protein L6452_12935 [Arctium lappa]
MSTSMAEFWKQVEARRQKPSQPNFSKVSKKGDFYKANSFHLPAKTTFLSHIWFSILCEKSVQIKQFKEVVERRRSVFKFES